MHKMTELLYLHEPKFRILWLRILFLATPYSFQGKAIRIEKCAKRLQTSIFLRSFIRIRKTGAAFLIRFEHLWRFWLRVRYLSFLAEYIMTAIAYICRLRFFHSDVCIFYLAFFNVRWLKFPLGIQVHVFILLIFHLNIQSLQDTYKEFRDIHFDRANSSQLLTIFAISIQLQTRRFALKWIKFLDENYKDSI